MLQRRYTELRVQGKNLRFSTRALQKWEMEGAGSRRVRWEGKDPALPSLPKCPSLSLSNYSCVQEPNSSSSHTNVAGWLSRCR